MGQDEAIAILMLSPCWYKAYSNDVDRMKLVREYRETMERAEQQVHDQLSKLKKAA